MKISVPVGSYATVHVPATKNITFGEGGKPATSQPFVQSIGSKDGYQIFRVESGDYEFKEEAAPK